MTFFTPLIPPFLRLQNPASLKKVFFTLYFALATAGLSAAQDFYVSPAPIPQPAQSVTAGLSAAQDFYGDVRRDFPGRDYPCAIPHASEADIPGTSDRMEGSTAVAIFIPNNTGANSRYPVAVEWTEQLLAEVIENVEANLQWWSDQAARYGVNKTFEIVLFGPDHPGTQVDYDPTLASSLGVVINDMISGIGYTEEAYPPAPDQDRGNLADRQRFFLEDLRDSLGTDWAFIGNIIAGAEWFRSHAALFGPNTNVWYQAARSGLVFAHEVGHIFGLRDTYRERAPFTAGHEMNGIKNRNADFRNPYTVPCIMKNNWGFSSYTAARLGWIDEPGYTTIQTVPSEAPFGVIYRNPETGQPIGTYGRTYHGHTSLPLGITHDITLTGFQQTGVDGLLFDNPQWSGPPEWSQVRGNSIDISVNFTHSVDVELQYQYTGNPADISVRFLYDESPVTSARTRAVHIGSDGSYAIAGLDGVVVLKDGLDFVLDAPHGRTDSQYRESKGLSEAPDGTVWFTTHFGEVIGWKDGMYTIMPEPPVPLANMEYGDIPAAVAIMEYGDIPAAVSAGDISALQSTPRIGALGPIAVDHDGVVWAAEDPHGTSGRVGGSGLHRFEASGRPVHRVIDVRNSPLISNNVSSLAVDDEGLLWIGFDGGRGGEFDQGLQRYHPGNEEWEDLSAQLPNKRVQVVRSAGGRIIVGHAGGYSEYRNGEWQHRETGLTGMVRDADVDLYGNVFLATVSGLAIYRNGEQVQLFTTDNSPMPENHVAAVRVEEPGRLLVGFWSHGAAVLTFDESLVTGSVAAELPVDMKLHQNFPNPFNPATVIRFGLPREMDVRLDVFDVLGRKVATLLDGRMEEGAHEAIFNASGMASGVYLYRLQAGDMLLSRKMLLLR